MEKPGVLEMWVMAFAFAMVAGTGLAHYASALPSPAVSASSSNIPLIAISAPVYGLGTNNFGRVYGLSLRNGSFLWNVTGHWKSLLGQSIAVVGDVNRDGTDDILAGAWSAYGTMNGTATLISGADGRVLHTFSGPDPYVHYGTSVSGTGDINHDGWPDMAVGEPGPFSISYSYLSIGKVYVYSGKDFSLIRTYSAENPYNDYFGSSVSNAGDVNTDGFDDLLVGAPGWDPWSNFYYAYGKVYLFSGKDGSLLYSWIAPPLTGRFGEKVAGVGDVNTDGFDDLAIGAGQGYDAAGGTLNGSISLFSGKDGSLLWLKLGKQKNSGLGTAVSGMGDVNRDGFNDVLAGAREMVVSGNSQAGEVYVLSGKDGSTLIEWAGVGPANFLGYSVSGVGDVNRDGIPDVLMGAPFSVLVPNSSGNAFVMDGRTGKEIFHWTGEQKDSAFGREVAGRWR